MKEDLNINLSDESTFFMYSKALSSNVRIEIIKHLSKKPMNLSELSKILSCPISTIYGHITILEDANIIITQSFPGKRGTQKLCALRAKSILFNLNNSNNHLTENNLYSINMPIGNYYNVKISSPCGLASESSIIGIEDNVSSFYSVDRFNAGIIWFSNGEIEYRFNNYDLLRLQNIKYLSFSFELCSEAIGYNNNWKSEIFIECNNNNLGSFISEGDYGGRKGKLNPDWWDDNMTQFGKLHEVFIKKDGTYIDNIFSSIITLDDILQNKSPFISLKLCVDHRSKFVGGLNLFGSNFGDYKQGIILTACY